MEIQLIKERELKNDTQHVHLYRMKDSDVWVAYGYSAYSLRLCAKSLGYDNLRGFSTFMNLPYTMVSFREVKRLRRRVTILRKKLLIKMNTFAGIITVRKTAKNR